MYKLLIRTKEQVWKSLNLSPTGMREMQALGVDRVTLGSNLKAVVKDMGIGLKLLPNVRHFEVKISKLD